MSLEQRQTELYAWSSLLDSTVFTQDDMWAEVCDLFTSIPAEQETDMDTGTHSQYMQAHESHPTQRPLKRSIAVMNDSDSLFTVDASGLGLVRTPYPMPLANLDSFHPTSLFSNDSATEIPHLHQSKRRMTAEQSADRQSSPSSLNRPISQYRPRQIDSAWADTPTNHAPPSQHTFHQSPPTDAFTQAVPCQSIQQPYYSFSTAQTDSSGTARYGADLYSVQHTQDMHNDAAIMDNALQPLTDAVLQIYSSAELPLSAIGVIDRIDVLPDPPLAAEPIDPSSGEEQPCYDPSTGRRMCAAKHCHKPLSEKRSENFCVRCFNKKAKQRRGPTIVPFLEDMDVDEAYRNVYTLQKHHKMWPMTSENQQDWEINSSPSMRKNWVKAIIDAMNKVYHMPIGRFKSEEDKLVVENWVSTQQGYNLKFHDQHVQYNARMINSRAHLLLEAAIQFQAGNTRTVYDDGGDNMGYTVNEKLLLSERLRLICDTLEQDKRVVMDVIEGRGVNAFVRDPDAFERRKIDNVKSNAKKRKIKQAALGTAEEDDNIEPSGSRKTQMMKTAKALREERESLAGLHIDSVINVGPPRGRQKKRTMRTPRLQTQMLSAGLEHDDELPYEHDNVDPDLLKHILEQEDSHGRIEDRHTAGKSLLLSDLPAETTHSNEAALQSVSPENQLRLITATVTREGFYDQDPQAGLYPCTEQRTSRSAQYLHMANHGSRVQTHSDPANMTASDYWFREVTPPGGFSHRRHE